MAGAKGKSGGYRPGAGRKPKPPTLIGDVTAGADNKDAPEVVEVVMASNGKDPIEFLEAIMLAPDLDAKLRIDAAKALLPYKHPKKGESGKKEQRNEDAKKVAGRFSTAAPPLRAVK